MSEFDLTCNYKKCKKLLTETAFITSCSHVFCEEDAIHEIECQKADKKCPACQSSLTHSYDLVKVILNPSEQFKSMVLAGIRPEFVMDIATRAIMFWIYQLQEENSNQKLVAKTLKDSIRQLKINCDVESGILKSKIHERDRKIDELEKELEIQKRKCGQLSEKFSEKIGEVHRWQAAYETMRRKQISETILQRGNNPINLGPKTMNDFLGRQDMAAQCHRSHEVRREEYNARIPDGRQGFHFQPQLKTSPKLFFGRDDSHRKM